MLLDEQISRQLARELIGHEVRTVQQGWAGLKNGDLLQRAAEAGYEVFISADQPGSRQQRSPGLMCNSATIVLIVAILAWPLGAEASETPASRSEGAVPAFAAEARSKIATVLAAEEFGHTETTTSLRARKPDKDQAQGGWLAGLRGLLRRVAKVLAVIGETFLWVGAALVVFLIVYYRGRWLPFLGRLRRVPKTLPVSREVRLAGQPLPDDIPSAALALWRAGRHAEALGLLYRGAIARAHERFELRLPLGATEGEALRAIARAAPAALDYFTALTRAWMALAYARRAPEAIAPEIEPLAEGFRRHLEET